MSTMIRQLLAAGGGVALLLSAGAAAQPLDAGEPSNATAPAPVAGDPAQAREDARKLRERGQQFLQQGFDEAAMRSFQRALEIYPAYPLVHNEVGVLFFKQGDLARAEASFLEAVRLDPDFADAWANLGEVRRRAVDLQGAGEAYRRAVELAPEDVQAYRALVVIFEEGKQPEHALWAMEGFLMAHPDPQAAEVSRVRKRAAELIRRGVVSKAPESMAEQTAAATDDAEASPGDADSFYEGAGVESKDEPGPLARHAGDLAFVARRFAEARSIYEQELVALPRDVVLLYKLGATYAAMNDYYGAMRWWRAALAIEPDRPLLIHHLGLAAMKLAERGQDGSLDAAVVSPDLEAARALLVDGRPQEAQRALEGLDGLEARYLRGEACLRAGELRKARAAFESVLGEAPTHRGALGGLAEVMVRFDSKSPGAADALRAWDAPANEDPEAFVVIRSNESASRIARGPEKAPSAPAPPAGGGATPTKRDEPADIPIPGAKTPAAPAPPAAAPSTPEPAPDKPAAPGTAAGTGKITVVFSDRALEAQGARIDRCFERVPEMIDAPAELAVSFEMNPKGAIIRVTVKGGPRHMTDRKRKDLAWCVRKEIKDGELGEPGRPVVRKRVLRIQP